MDINQMFPSKYLKCADLKGYNVPVVMTVVDQVDVSGPDDPGGDLKPVLFFQGKEKGLVLNKTNAHAITEIYGPETTMWRGQTIVLVPSRTDFRGRTVDCIRIAPPTAGAIATQQPSPHIPAPSPEPPTAPVPAPDQSTMDFTGQAVQPPHAAPQPPEAGPDGLPGPAPAADFNDPEIPF